MKYLLDTHVIIWYYENLSKIPPEINKIIDNPRNNIYISSASLWEIAIKINLNKLTLNFTFDKLINDIKKGDFEILQIEDKYLKKLANLPLIHKDPFDRLLVATVLADNLTLITTDENIHKYKISWIWKN